MVNDILFHLINGSFKLIMTLEHGVRLTAEMLETLEYSLQSTGRQPATLYYIKFLHAWRTGDYKQANENLRSYFDFASLKHPNSRYQYALLNLAMMQADFGCREEAIWAIQEAIRTAREYRDSVCLNFCLSWVTEMQAEFPGHYSHVAADDENTLRYLKAKAQESSMPDLHSTVYLAETRQLMAEGASPTEIVEALDKSAFVIASMNIPSTIETLYSAKATLWNRLGVHALSSFYTRVGSNVYSSTSIFNEETVRARCRTAYSEALNGFYDQSLKTLFQIEDLASANRASFTRWSVYGNLVKLKRAIRNQWTSEATEYFGKLQCMEEISDAEISFEIAVISVDYHLLIGNTEVAVSLITKHLDSAVFLTADIYMQLRYQIAYANVMNKIGSNYRGYSLMMRTVAISEKNCIVPCLIDAIFELCAVFISSKQFDSVLSILDSVFPFANACSDYEMLARAFYLTFVAMVGANDSLNDANLSIDSEKEDMLRKVAHSIKYARRALVLYRQLQDAAMVRELTSSLTRLYNILGEQFNEGRKEFLGEYFENMEAMKLDKNPHVLLWQANDSIDRGINMDDDEI